MSLNSSGLTPTAASTAVSAASGVWLRRVLLAVAAFESLLGLLDFYELFDLYDATLSFGQFVIKARLFIHPFFAIAALVLAARRYLRAAIVVLAANILAALAMWSPDLIGLPLLAQQVIFGPLAVTAIVLAILDKLLWLGAVFVALPSATLLLDMIPLILFAIAVIIHRGAPPPNRPYLGAVGSRGGRPRDHGITCKPLNCAANHWHRSASRPNPSKICFPEAAA